MSIGMNERPAAEQSGQETVKKKRKKPVRQKKNRYPQKRTMNLYYKPDRTTKPATVALHVLFVLACLLGVGKFLVYDLWMKAKTGPADSRGGDGRAERRHAGAGKLQ